MTDDQLNQRFGQLVDAQLRFQQQLGDMAGVVRDLAENQRQIIQQQEWMMERQEWMMQRQEQILHRLEESDQRFNVMLQEIRFLIRRLPPTDDQIDDQTNPTT